MNIKNMTITPIFEEIDLMLLRKSRTDDTKEPIEITLKRHEEQLQELSIKTTGKPTKEEILKDTNQDKIMRYKKGIPILADTLKKYDTLSIQEKNELLKDIFIKVEYEKTYSLA